MPENTSSQRNPIQLKIFHLLKLPYSSSLNLLCIRSNTGAEYQSYTRGNCVSPILDCSTRCCKICQEFFSLCVAKRVFCCCNCVNQLFNVWYSTLCMCRTVQGSLLHKKFYKIFFILDSYQHNVWYFTLFATTNFYNFALL